MQTAEEKILEKKEKYTNLQELIGHKQEVLQRYLQTCNSCSNTGEKQPSTCQLLMHLAELLSGCKAFRATKHKMHRLNALI